ncbi:AbiH family protein [Wenyingzhuangia aestuarii]|uniref:AbiH family protein n=1 Tax=Wenyingzhuangia aestuarii TaxID=1647582 RepID=UPI00143C50C4|nr:AbiH family protein [Wenyingzhuangia aestuarii]NJB82750.1 hypothetical protein [Wenyingzhuangia aestuarii]
MKNIFIIGNGFDLAHGYNTDYTSFVEWLIESSSKLITVVNIRDAKGKILWMNSSVEVTAKGNNTSYQMTKNKVLLKYDIFVENKFLKEIISQTNINKWCDIEVLYFELLNKTLDPTLRESPIKLNTELTQVKKELETYLGLFNKEDNAISEFSSFFERVGKDRDNLILNFNYTNTFERLYKDKIEHVEVLNFHGQLSCTVNPIIFGYAPTEEETKLLIDRNNNEFLKNIKRYYYKQTNCENKLFEFMEALRGRSDLVNKINVFVIGHSCGVSDRKILNEVFTNKNVVNINIMYYKDYQGYFDTLVNIDRVIGKESHYGVIRNYKLSLKCPQVNEEGDYIFNDYLSLLVDDIIKTKSDKEHNFR